MGFPPILMYHWFCDGGPSASRSPQLEITPRLFEQQMDHLAAAGYKTISLQQALEQPNHARRSMVLTFDDGTLDFWEHARPVLRRHGFTATLFVVTDHVGGESSWDAELGEPARPLMNWDQIRELGGEGFEIGSHTHRHRPFVDLEPDAVREELAVSRDRIARELGQAPRYFAYPRGFYRAEHKQLVREAGYDGACAVILGWGDLRYSDRFEMKRMTIKGTESMLRFKLRLRLAHRVGFSDAALPADSTG